MNVVNRAAGVGAIETPSEATRGSQTPARVVLGLAVAVIYAQLLAFGADSGFLSALFALAEMLLTVVALLVLGGEATKRFWRTLAAPLGLVAIAIGWALLGESLGAPLVRGAAGLELVKLAGVAGLLVTGALIGRERGRFEALCLTLAVAGLAYTLLSLGLARLDPLTVWGQSKGAHAYRFTGTLTNANAAGCLFGMIALVSIGCGLSLARRLNAASATLTQFLELMLIACAGFAALAASILTSSRTSLIVTLLLGAAIIAVAARRGGWLKPGRAMVALGALGCGAALAMAQVAWRWRTLSVDFDQRMLGYVHYVDLSAKAPLFGFGLGAFRSLNQAALTPATAPYVWDFGAAHSAVLQAALEGGWPYALLLCAAVVAVALPISAAAREAGLGGMGSGPVAAAALAGVCAMEDIALNVPAIAALCALLLGASLGASVPRRHRRYYSAEPAAPESHRA